MNRLRVGYIPLTDAAVLIAAAERGFTARAGIELILEREASWATLRDKLALGLVDAAHMLAPLAIATTLGIGPATRQPLVSAFALNLNGNAITLSNRLWQRLGLPPTASAAEVARALAARKIGGEPAPVFATVFPYSTHTYLLRRFLRHGGLDPDQDVRITVVPPPYMADALRTGAVDGFCVGSPWNSVAVEAGMGRIVAFGTEIVPRAPEKLLAWPRRGQAADFADALVPALQAAADWCAAPENRRDVAGLLAREDYLGIRPALIQRTLDGALLLGPDGPIRHDPDYLLLGGAVHRPDPSQARWLYAAMVEAGHVAPGREEDAVAVYDADAYGRLVTRAGLL